MVEHLPKYFPLVSVPSVCFHLLSVESLFNKSLSHNFSIIFFGQNLSSDPLFTVSYLSHHILKCLFTNLFFLAVCPVFSFLSFWIYSYTPNSNCLYLHVWVTLTQTSGAPVLITVVTSQWQKDFLLALEGPGNLWVISVSLSSKHGSFYLLTKNICGLRWNTTQAQ